MTDPQTGEVFAYKVEAPMNATGFVAKSSVRDASRGRWQACIWRRARLDRLAVE
ncbi:MAG: hypothetical protein R3B46_00155 [Phycisphaerales bacterium]